MVDAGEELMKLEAELEYTRGFLSSVQKKMSNERFVQHAPEQVVEKERQKMADAEGKISVLEAQINKLRGQA
jgi:valyl-tRNA synthetase